MAFLVTFGPLAVRGSSGRGTVLHACRQLARVTVEARVHCGRLLRRDTSWRGRAGQRKMVVSRHGVEGLGEVSSAFEDNLLWKFLRVTRVPGYKFPKTVETVIDAGIGQS